MKFPKWNTLNVQDLRQWPGAIRAYLRRIWVWLTTADVREEATRYLKNNPGWQPVPYWIAAAGVGVVAVSYAELFHYFSELSKQAIFYHPHLFFLFSPLCFLIAWWVVDRFAPRAAGSGIPQVRAAILLDGNTPKKTFLSLLGLRTGLIKVVSSVLCALGGGAIGREGPTIQIAAGLFYVIGLQSRKIWPRVGHQPWLISGGAAGLAAAFNTPLGGIVFAIEELSTLYFAKFKLALISAVIIAGMVAQWIWGPYLFFGFPQINTVTPVFVFTALLVGILCGICGGYFGKGLWKAGQWIKALSRRDRAWCAATAGFCIALLGYFLQDRVFGGGAEVVRELLFNDEAGSDIGLVFGRVAATFISYLSGVAGGIFSPSLAIGGAIGSYIDAFINTGNGNLMVLLGMAAFLSAVTRAPFTALVLVFEMTDRHSAIFHLMLASLSAYVIARFIDGKSFYDRLIEETLASEAARPETTP